MVFTSNTFIVFFLVVYAVYVYMIRKDIRLSYQNFFLLVASYVFYGAWNYKFLFLLAFTSLVDYYLALAIFRTEDKKVKRRWLVLSICLNLGVLFFFKYLNFGIESAAALLEMLGMEPHITTLSIILPVGISFFTFQSMTYTIDVYRGELKPTTNVVDFLLYVSFFPQLVAGPIERAADLLPQLQTKRSIRREDIRKGLYWIVVGYFKKIVIADTLAPFVEYSIGNSSSVSGMVSFLGIVAFSLQIYGDFAGYTYIARGVAKMMGIDLTKNFERPYLATSPRDFWRRWHISLSTWLRIYLYFSLGGKNVSKGRKYFNLMTTMVLGGIWHGASWNFVIWGFYHGFLLVCDHVANDFNVKMPGFSALGEGLQRALKVFGMYLLTLYGWLLFRVTDLGKIKEITTNVFTNFLWTREVSMVVTPVLTAYLLLMTLHIFQERKRDELILMKVPNAYKAALIAFALACILTVGIRATPFIYFQF